LTATSPIFGQKSDTIWLDGKFKPVEQAKARYFRFARFDAQRKKWHIEDFFMNGKPQMQGWSDAPDSEHMVDSVFKYLESGRLESVCEHKTYESGWISFFDDKKRRSCRLFCEKQLKNGKATFYNADGSVFSKAVFKNDTMFSGIRPHVICYNHFNPHASVKYKNGKAIEEIKLYPNGKIARKTKLGYGLFSPVSAVFWDEKGKKIGACTFDKHYDKPLDGTFVEYSDKDKFFDFYSPAIVTKIVTMEQGKPVHARSFDPKGSLIAECAYKNGLPFNGLHVEGTVIMTYLEGANTGLNTHFTKNFGQKQFDVQMLNGQENGETRNFGSDGSIPSTGVWQDGGPFSGRIFHNRELCDYVEGEKNGVCQTFFEDGTLESSTHFKQDQPDGEATVRSQNGLFQTKGNYREGKMYEGTFARKGGQRISLRYETGNLVETTYFFPDTFVVQRIEAAKNGFTKEFGRDSRQLFEGELRDGKRFSGRFRDKNSILSYKNGLKHGVCEILSYDDKPIRIEQYADDKLNGETIFYKNGKIAARGFYKNGQPYQGRFIEGEANGNHGIYEYRDSLKNGTAFIFFNSVQATVPFVGGQRDGMARFSWTKYDRNKVDTFYFTGVYRDNKPFEGDFIEVKRQEQYKNGLLDGQVKQYANAFGGEVTKTETYRAGKLDGETVIFLKKRPFVGQFREGKAWSGWHELKNASSYEKTFARMEDGEPTGDKFEFIEGYQELETRNGQPFSGFIKEKEQPFSKHFYTDGARTLTVLELPYSRDTLGIIKYSNDTATMFAPNGHILEKTVFTKPYDSGTTDIYSTVQGIHVGHIVFEAGKLKSGYFRPEEHLQPEKQRWGMAQFSKLNDTIIVETAMKDSPLIVVRKSGAQFDIPWPMNFEVFLNELEGKKGSTTYHYHQGPDANPAFKIIATLENDGEGHLTGILIRESSWGLSISKYNGGRSAVETMGSLTWKQVLEQIEKWEKK
jgi:antitoxin component YwqK of YwqJK toxin-antitoxin module